jgi:hypothetical protein
MVRVFNTPGRTWLAATARGTFMPMRWMVTCWLLGTVWVSGCKDHAPSPAEIADRGWRAHEIVVSAGERAATCAGAGVAMQAAFTAHRQDFVAAVELDKDPAALRAATDWLAAHEERYADLETRMEALSGRCADDPTVQAAFRQMETP